MYLAAKCLYSWVIMILSDWLISRHWPRFWWLTIPIHQNTDGQFERAKVVDTSWPLSDVYPKDRKNQLVTAETELPIRETNDQRFVHYVPVSPSTHMYIHIFVYYSLVPTLHDHPPEATNPPDTELSARPGPGSRERNDSRSSREPSSRRWHWQGWWWLRMADAVW